MRKGFSLIELLIYVGILGAISMFFIGILTTSTRVQVHEVALAEVGNQANFVLQTVQRLVRESSLIDEVCPDTNPSACPGMIGDNPDTGKTEISYLKLRMKDLSKDPTCISLMDDGVIYVTQGPGSDATSCKDNSGTESIITSKVTIPTNPIGLSLKLISNSPAHNLVEVGLTMDYANAPPGGNFSKVLRTAVGRVSAATFDSDLIPSTADSRDIGQGIARWQDLFVNNIDVSGTISEGGNYDGLGRGFMIPGAQTGQTCQNVCSSHGLVCTTAYNFQQCGAGCLGGANDYILRTLACGGVVPAPGAFCVCN